ncbi:hypothetical protein EJ08DRAFT_415462 [Tothia fuscella]|uniref:SRR1-like domain-containing protein n=1 Tax=Tothia fuscella TaxID=1048955 RepID=A0A9P4NJG9_9PEZI|nr:hypothetical protein EJ08DRAFT_415462 [Tothia fuscella]
MCVGDVIHPISLFQIAAFQSIVDFLQEKYHRRIIMYYQDPGCSADGERFLQRLGFEILRMGDGDEGKKDENGESMKKTDYYQTSEGIAQEEGSATTPTDAQEEAKKETKEEASTKYGCCCFRHPRHVEVGPAAKLISSNTFLYMPRACYPIIMATMLRCTAFSALYLGLPVDKT